MLISTVYLYASVAKTPVERPAVKTGDSDPEGSNLLLALAAYPIRYRERFLEIRGWSHSTQPHPHGRTE